MKYRAILLAFSTLATPASAQSIDDILAANRLATGGDAWNGKAAMSETYTYAGQGLTGKTATTFDLSGGRFVDSYDVGPASGAQGFDGMHAWAKDPSGTVTAQDGGSALPLAFNEAYRDANLWWRPDHGGAAIAIDPAKSDASYEVLSVTPKNGENFEVWFDRKTHLLTRLFEQQGPAPTTSTFSDYRSIDGAMVAGKIVQSTGNAKYDQTQTLLSANFLPAQEDAFFAQPKIVMHDVSIANGAHEAVLPFKLINNHIYAYVKIDGQGPYLFIFDTGGVNLVTPTLAKALGHKVEGQMEARGNGSGTMESGFTKVGKLELGDAAISAQTFAALPLDALSDVEGFDQSGMIGFETFRRFVTRIDYGAHTITLIEPKYFDSKDAGTAVPLKFDGNVAEVEAAYNGIHGTFMLDTGARSSLTLTSPFVAKHGLRAIAAKGVDAATGWGVGGITRSYVERAGTLSFAGSDVENAVVQLSTDTGGGMAQSDIAGNIGAGILKRYVLTLDYEHNVAYVKPAAGPIADLDTFDRAGLWINRDPKGFKIEDVTQHAPAAEGGLKVGDIVTAVDGKPATSLTVYDVRYRFRNDPPGTKVALTIERDGDTSTHVITLRDLI
jgi:PDZ domain-containing protein/aspartyl protease